MARIRAVVVDDEDLVRERVMHLLSETEDFEVCAECTNGDQAIKAITKIRPDVVFLDIKMPKVGGFQVLDAIESFNTIVVFITAYDVFALKAFDYEAFDYIVKPINKQRFQKTISRIRKSIKEKTSGKKSYLIVRDAGKIKRIEITQISHLEASDNYVKIFTGSRVYKKRVTLAMISGQLQNEGFVRVHRSYTINISHIQDMARIYQGDYLIKLANGRVVPTSRSYRDYVKFLVK